MNNKNDATKTVFELIVQYFLPFLAIAALAAAFWRVFTPSQQHFERLDEKTLLYVGVAGVLLLLREVKSVAFGDYKVEFDRIREIAAEANNKAENAQAVALGSGKSDEGKKSASEETPRPGTAPDDPWKGVFGGKNAHNNRLLTAEVLPVRGGSNLFSIKLAVTSTKPIQDPLNGVVQFFLHDTFNNDRPVINVGPQGSAKLKLTAWGAFTVGAMTDDGKTKLELDLAELEDAPVEFRNA